MVGCFKVAPRFVTLPCGRLLSFHRAGGGRGCRRRWGYAASIDRAAIPYMGTKRPRAQAMASCTLFSGPAASNTTTDNRPAPKTAPPMMAMPTNGAQSALPVAPIPRPVAPMPRPVLRAPLATWSPILRASFGSDAGSTSGVPVAGLSPYTFGDCHGRFDSSGSGHVRGAMSVAQMEVKKPVACHGLGYLKRMKVGIIHRDIPSPLDWAA